MTLIPDVLRWLSAWSTVLAPIAAGAFTLWRFVLWPRVAKPAIVRSQQKRQRNDRIDRGLEKIDLVYDILTPNGGSSLVDQVKRIQIAVNRTEARQGLFSDFSEQALFEADAEGRYTRVNVAFERMSGYSSAELRGLGWKNLVHDEDRERVSREYGHAVKDRRACRLDCRFITKGGLQHRIEMNARPAMDDANREVTTWMGSVNILKADGRSAA